MYIVTLNIGVKIGSLGGVIDGFSVVGGAKFDRTSIFDVAPSQPPTLAFSWPYRRYAFGSLHVKNF
jgi:hypothetical protein